MIDPTIPIIFWSQAPVHTPLTHFNKKDGTTIYTPSHIRISCIDYSQATFLVPSVTASAPASPDSTAMLFTGADAVTLGTKNVA